MRHNQHYTQHKYQLSSGSIYVLKCGFHGCVPANRQNNPCRSDYRASERTFQLLTQAAGRAGRAEKSGNVVIQTYTPEHFSIVSAANQDYNAFYEQEIAYRKLCGYPPVDNLMKIMLSSPDEVLLTKSAVWVKTFVDNNCKAKGLMCIGPADGHARQRPCFHSAREIECQIYP